MCTVIILRRPGHDWPVLIAANRDERLSRPWRPPGRHWPDRPSITAGLDGLQGGSWIGLNDWGVFAVVLNRRGTLGPADDKQSRGELVLRALRGESADAALSSVTSLDVDAYRPFNMIVADRDAVFWVARRGSDEGPQSDGSGGPAPLHVAPVPAGLSMIAADDLNDPRTPRLARLQDFEAAPAPDPLQSDSWHAWEELLADRRHAPADGPIGALCVVTDRDYGTVSSSLLALPAAHRPDLAPVWRFAAGRPGSAPFAPVLPTPALPAD